MPVRSQRNSAERGLSLLGVLISAAAAVLVVGALAGLAQRSRQATRATSERTVATFLAREGIELVRAIRDTNWLTTPRCAATGACTIFWRGATSGRGAICNGTFRVDAATVDAVGLVPTTAGAEDTRLRLSGITYGHASGTVTTFKRWIEVRSSDQGCGEASVFVLPTPAPAGRPSPRASPTPTPSPLPTPRVPPPLTLTSVVEWTLPGAATRRVELVEQLYPWLNVR